MEKTVLITGAAGGLGQAVSSSNWNLSVWDTYIASADDQTIGRMPHQQ